MTFKKIILRKHSQVAIAFLNYYLQTGLLAFGSTGENQGVPPDELWNRFIAKGPGQNMAPMGFNSEIEQLTRERDLVVKNNNQLKQQVTELELKLLECKG